MTKTDSKTGHEASARPSKLAPRQLKALDMILSCRPQQEIAQELGVTRQTISEWKNRHPIFKATLEALIAEVNDELHHTAPMRHAFVTSQLVKLTVEGTPETRLKAIQYYFEHFAPKDEAIASFNEADTLLLKVLQRRQSDSAAGSAVIKERSE